VAIAMVVTRVGATLLLSNLPQSVKLVIAGLALLGINLILRLDSTREDEEFKLSQHKTRTLGIIRDITMGPYERFE
jgi:hypothetical protein